MTTPIDPQSPYYSNLPLPNPRPTSVTVVAIIGIILGGMGVLCMPFAVIPYVVNIGPPNPAIDIIKDHPANMAFMISSLIYGFLNTILLLAASIACLKLKPWARMGMIVYAVLALISAVAGTIFNIVVLFPALYAMRSTSPGGAGAFAGGVGGGIAGTLFGIALPIVIIVVMRMPHVVDAFRGSSATGN